MVEHRVNNSIMSGENPPLYCTLALLIVTQVHQNRGKRHDVELEPGYSSILLPGASLLGLGTDGCQHYFVTI